MLSSTVFNPARDFEPGLLGITVNQARNDPSWVENQIIETGLSRKAPWVLSVQYNDGGILQIPLTLLSGDVLDGPNVKVVRRHKTTGRLMPFQILLSDPHLSQSNLSAEQAFVHFALPRFDKALTPKLLGFVNQEIAIRFAIGAAEIAELQAYTVGVADLGWQVTRKPATRAAIKVVQAAVAALDENALAAKLVEDTSSLAGEPLRQLLECARRLGQMPLSPRQIANIVTEVCDLLGYEYSVIDKTGRILIVGKNARGVIQISGDGVTFGRFSPQSMDIVNPMPIKSSNGY